MVAFENGTLYGENINGGVTDWDTVEKTSMVLQYKGPRECKTWERIEEFDKFL